MRGSTKVRWVMRFCGSGTCDVIRKDRTGTTISCVRVHGSVVDSAEAREYARDFLAGKPLPSYIQAF